MTSRRFSGNSKLTLKQKLLSKNEFNFANRFLWKLPEINAKHRSISPVFSPIRQRDPGNSRIKRNVTMDISEQIERIPEEKMVDKPNNEKIPKFFIEGTQKVCNKQYFRKTFLTKILVPRQSPQKVRKVSVFNDTELDAWNIEY